MKTVFVKAYTHVNLGDDLFLRILFERYSNTKFLIIAPEYYKRILPLKNIRIITSLPKEQDRFYAQLAERSDAFILIGGSIFMQMRNGTFNGYENTYNRFLTTLFADKNKYIIGANFGPFYDTDFNDIYEQLFSQYTDICFREKYSYDLFSHLPQTRYRLDIVFQYKLPKVEKEKGSVGFSLLDLSNREALKIHKDDYEQMIVQMIELLLKEGRVVCLFAFCLFEGDAYAIERILEKLSPTARSSVKTVYYEGDLDDFLNRYLRMESVFTTRFHAMIVSLMAKQNTYPLIYSDKMLHVLNDLNYQGAYSMISELKNQEAGQMIVDICNNQYNITSEDVKNSEEQFEQIDKFLKCKKKKNPPIKYNSETVDLQFDESDIASQMRAIKKFQAPDTQLPESIDIEYAGMGKIIFYYHYAHNMGDKGYIKKADDLLDKLLFSLEFCVKTVKNDFCKVGCSMIYLLRNNFVKGNEDHILSETDQLVFRSICYRNKNDKTDWYSLLHYLKLRVTENTNKKDKYRLLTNKRYLCEALNVVGRDERNNIISDKRIVAEMEDVYNMGLCKGIIKRILDKSLCEKTILNPINDNAVTFVIPIRVNFPERKRNLFLLLEHLRRIPDSSIIIVEADNQPHLENVQNDFASYYFIEDNDPVFHTTKYRNMLLSLAKTPIVAIWDTDVIIPENQIIKAISEIQKGCIMSFPYDGRFYTLSAEESEQYCKNKCISLLMKKENTFSQIFGTYSVGGAFMVNKDGYIKFGGENEYMYGWGSEDLERIKRIEILGFLISRVEGPLFHLYHPRTSWYDNKKTERRNITEFVKICNMTKQELINYIKTWKFSKYKNKLRM